MAIISKRMDDLTIHIGGHQRAFPGPPQVSTIGWIPNKRGRVQWQMTTWNFSLILAGEGTYRCDDRLIPVRSPCVITQRPGIALDYGPHTTWRELYLMYDPDQLSALQRARLMLAGRAWWPVGDPGRFLAAASDLVDLIRQPDPTDHVDRIDRAAEMVVVESLLGSSSAALTGSAQQVARIRTLVESDIMGAHDFVGMARDHGVSPTHFRRIWEEQVGCPPARHVMNLRLRRACRLLVESQASIAAVAAQAGFSDPFHFSRRFRARFGLAPQAYRERHKPR